MKARIVQQLGEVEVLLPARVAEGLAANDRAKVCLSVLQAIAKHAIHPAEVPDDLSAECAAAGLDAAALRSMVAAAWPTSPSRIAAAGLAKLVRSLFDDIGAMIAAVTAGDATAGSEAAGRLQALQARLSAEHDEIEVARITELSALPEGADSLHRLVMDLHKALTRLSAACAEEDVAGLTRTACCPTTRRSSRLSCVVSIAPASLSSIIRASAAILTAAGGRTAHAALVARHMGKPCVVGCETLRVDEENHQARLADARITEGDWVSIDGGSGEVFLGQRKIVTELPEAELRELESWRADNAARQSACRIA
jgi:phosphohistidine swiveling domain-containing protein